MNEIAGFLLLFGVHSQIVKEVVDVSLFIGRRNRENVSLLISDNHILVFINNVIRGLWVIPHFGDSRLIHKSYLFSSFGCSVGFTSLGLSSFGFSSAVLASAGFSSGCSWAASTRPGIG